MAENYGRDPSGQALVQAPSPSVSAASGFDPSRLTDADILELAGRAVREVRALPAGYLVDPGSASGVDRLQRDEPTTEQCLDMARRGGFYETLYTGSAIERIVIHAVRAAIATEAGTAETENTGSVHEGAGLKGIAQNQDPSPFKSEGNSI